MAFDPARLQKKLSVVLHPFATLYRFILRLRRSVWETGLARRLSPACPCVSVGNIAWGGTGKTPLTDWLMSWAERKNLKTVVLSRGYKADLSIAPVYVKAHHSPREVGDEPLMLGLDHPACAVLVDPNRRRSGAYALKALSPDLLLLDDGFQHLAVRRDLDMVLLRPADLRAEWGRVIPAGSWREGVSALSRAGVFLIKCSPAEMQALVPACKERLEALQRPIFSFTLKPTALERVGDTGTGGSLGNRPYVLVTGVGNPQQVAETVEAFLGHPPEAHLVFPDHYTYIFKDTARFERLGMPIVCTRKDAVKLRRLPLAEVWALRVEVCFGPRLWSSRTFPEWIDAWWEQQGQELLSALAPQKHWTGFSAGTGLTFPPPPVQPVPPQPSPLATDEPAGEDGAGASSEAPPCAVSATGQDRCAGVGVAQAAVAPSPSPSDVPSEPEASLPEAAESAESAEPSDLAEPSQSSQPSQSAELAEPSQPSERAEPVTERTFR